MLFLALKFAVCEIVLFVVGFLRSSCFTRDLHDDYNMLKVTFYVIFLIRKVKRLMSCRVEYFSSPPRAEANNIYGKIDTFGIKLYFFTCIQNCIFIWWSFILMYVLLFICFEVLLTYTLNYNSILSYSYLYMKCFRNTFILYTSFVTAALILATIVWTRV